MGFAIPPDVADITGFVVRNITASRRIPLMRLFAPYDVRGRQIEGIQTLLDQSGGPVWLDAVAHEVHDV